MNETERILDVDANVTRVENTYLRKKVLSESENETTAENPPTEYAGRITELTGFLLFLLDARERLAVSIRAAKDALDIDMDSEVGLNARRQSIAATFKRMADLRSTEVLIPNGGIGFRFNADGNQVPYKCDVRRVTTINFDRNEVRKRLSALSARADAVSAALDRCLVNAAVDFVPPFDVNDSFSEVFDAYLALRS